MNKKITRIILVMDTLTTEQRSKNMSKIRSKDSKPEITVRKMLFKEGFRFRLHDKKLPGKPDIVLKKYKTVIFVHGCFWHQHEGCKRANMPKSNLEYWVPKIERNVQRDEEHTEKLKNAGWNVIVIWECEVKNIEKLKDIFNSIKQIQPLNPTYRNSWHQET